MIFFSFVQMDVFLVREVPEEPGSDAGQPLQPPGTLQALLPQEHTRGHLLTSFLFKCSSPIGVFSFLFCSPSCPQKWLL